jgi:hypothetical protein
MTIPKRSSSLGPVLKWLWQGCQGKITCLLKVFVLIEILISDHQIKDTEGNFVVDVTSNNLARMLHD